MRARSIAAFVLALFLVPVTGVVGQEESKAEAKRQLDERVKQRIERRLTRLNQVLKLTDEQKQKIRAILEKNAAQFTPMDRQQFRSLSPEERQRKREELRAHWLRVNNEIEKVLNPEQVKKFREMQRRARKGRRVPPGQR